MVTLEKKIKPLGEELRRRLCMQKPASGLIEQPIYY